MPRSRAGDAVADMLRGEMKRIPQRELRNQIGAVLRAAENGEEFVITVDCRPVATLGPFERRRWVSRERVQGLLATPTDPRLLDDVRRLTRDNPDDPWRRR